VSRVQVGSDLINQWMIHHHRHRHHLMTITGSLSKVTDPMLSWVYSEYSFRVIPWIGELVAHDRDSYQYLVESIARFPSQTQFEVCIIIVGVLY